MRLGSMEGAVLLLWVSLLLPWLPSVILQAVLGHLGPYGTLPGQGQGMGGHAWGQTCTEHSDSRMQDKVTAMHGAW